MGSLMTPTITLISVQKWTTDASAWPPLRQGYFLSMFLLTLFQSAQRWPWCNRLCRCFADITGICRHGHHWQEVHFYWSFQNGNLKETWRMPWDCMVSLSFRERVIGKFLLQYFFGHFFDIAGKSEHQLPGPERKGCSFVEISRLLVLHFWNHKWNTMC